MNRHVISGYYGSKDSFSATAKEGEVVTRLNLLDNGGKLANGVGAAINDLQKIDVFPTETAIDLMIVAAHVQAADTQVSRETESQDTWTREMRLVIPVSNKELWEGAELTLNKMLGFLTGDIWIVEFRKKPKLTLAHERQKLAAGKQSPFDALSLFSGGLDSLIGAVDLLENGKTPLLVSHASEGAASGAQQECFNVLKASFPKNKFERLRLWMSIKDLNIGKSEMTTRGRSFLFFSAGVLAGSGLGKRFTLRVPENGLIALNIPLDKLRLGSHSTRTTHPYYMARWNDLLQMLNIEGGIENPYWNKTKGEMTSDCKNKKLLATIVPMSMSCSSPTKGRWQGLGIQHCGYCLPCIIRRAALEKGLGAGNDPTTYTTDLKSTIVLDTQKAEGRQIRSFQFASKRLAANPAVANTLIHSTGPLDDESEERQVELAEVYRRGMAEVGQLVGAVKAEPK